MAAPGRPTPQRDRGEAWPRYQDQTEFVSTDANPYTVSHREEGRPVITASEGWPLRGRWHEEFGREAPLHVEIGSGNGFFLSGLALQHPEWDVLGIEIRYKRVVLCARKIRVAGVSNARILRYHAAFLDDLFLPGTLAGLYVNHPDPWPRERQEKNRLISRWFLEDVARLLKPGAWMRLKSDHKPNIDRVSELLDRGPDGEPLPRLPLRVTGYADDVTTGPAPWPDDIETNYQRKFRLRGLPVYALEVVREPDEVSPPPA